MAKLESYRLLSQEEIAQNTFKMVLEGDITWINAPGKFLNIAIDHQYLKRPISVADYESNHLTLIYKVVGEGTKKMSFYQKGHIVDALVGLGNGFTLRQEQSDVLLIGGGVGIPPLYALAKKCLDLGQKVTVVLGFQSSKDAFMIDDFKALNANVFVATNDGTLGTKGYVTDVIKENHLTHLYYFTCGPKAMLKSVYDLCDQGQLSFEEHMGCGFGACMGCSHKTKFGYKRICVEGPVLESEEVLWED